MFFFLPGSNYREKIGYFSIFSNHLILLILPFLLMMVIISYGRTMAQATDFGGIDGYVKRYSDNSPIQGVDVYAFDSQNKDRGHAETGSNGYYKIKFGSPPTESYRVCVRKDGYNPECYQEPGINGCSGRDCGAFWPAEATNTQGTLVSIQPPKIVRIDFRIALGGKIKGHISGVLEESPDPNKWVIDYKVFLEGDTNYKKNDSIKFKIELYKEPDNDYLIQPGSTIVIPPGNYTVRAEDHSFLKDQMSLPYYYTVYYDVSGGTYIKDNATIITYTIDKQITKTANFTIRKGGLITGFVKESFGDYVALLDIRVEGKEKNLEITKETQTRTIEDSDPNSGKTYNGYFSLTGLPPGSYIIKIDDTPIGTKYGDPNLQIYLPEYYNDVYFENEATLITISASDIAKPDYKGTFIEVFLQKGPVIKGCAMDQDKSLCSLNQYDPNDGLTGITIEIRPDFQSFSSQLPIEVQTDPNGYIFKEFKKMLPGQYKIRAKDTSFKYFPTDFKTFTVEAGGEYEINFCMEKVPTGHGNGNISGHVYLDENPEQPLPGIKMLLFNNISPDDSLFMTTNNNGEFFFNDIDPGEYRLSSTETYEDLIYEIYKDITVLDPNKFIEGTINWEDLFLEATAIFLLPGENITNVDIGLSTYQYTFGSGLNLFGYPGLPVERYDHTNEFCSELDSELDNFRTKDPNTGQWYVINTSNLHNKPKQLHTGQGYFIYMKNQAGPFFFPPFKIMPPKFYQLESGKNIIAYPSSLHRPIKRSSDLLNKLGTPEEVASVKSFDNTSGKWKSTVWLWNKPGVADFPIVQGEGYVAEMWISKQVETDEPNI